MEYFEERATGSIYSVRELGQLLRSRQPDMREVARRCRPLPGNTCVLVEEAEMIAAEAADEQGDWGLSPGCPLPDVSSSHRKRGVDGHRGRSRRFLLLIGVEGAAWLTVLTLSHSRAPEPTDLPRA